MIPHFKPNAASRVQAPHNQHTICCAPVASTKLQRRWYNAQYSSKSSQQAVPTGDELDQVLHLHGRAIGRGGPVDITTQPRLPCCWQAPASLEHCEISAAAAARRTLAVACPRSPPRVVWRTCCLQVMTSRVID